MLELALDSDATDIKGQIPVIGVRLCFFYSNCPGFTNLDAALTSHTLFCIYRLGFFVLEFKNLGGTNFHAFPTAGALILIHSRYEHKVTPPFPLFFKISTSKPMFQYPLSLF
jgi:hypothetical protein